MEILIPWKRKVKNAVFQYNDTQIKVRDATSNDPWNPPLGLLIELADLSKRQYELVSIMQVIWKRVNDRGSNWRHCYKSLFVLEYLIKMGDPQVYQQCKQNMRALQVLTQFQYVDEYGKDVGMNVRQKAVQVLELLMNDAKLLEEREKEARNREKHEKMQQQLRQQQMQQQQQQATLGSKSMPVTPKSRDTYVHRLDRNAAMHNSSAGYDDPYGGATGSSYPNPNDYGQQPYQQPYAYQQSIGAQNSQYPSYNQYAAQYGQYPQYPQYGQYQQPYAQQAAVFNPFQATGQVSAEQQQAMLSFGSSPEEIKQRMATNPFLCDLSAAPQAAAGDENNLPQSVVKDEDFFAALDSAALKALQPEVKAPADASAHASNGAIDADVASQPQPDAVATECEPQATPSQPQDTPDPPQAVPHASSLSESSPQTDATSATVNNTMSHAVDVSAHSDSAQSVQPTPDSQTEPLNHEQLDSHVQQLKVHDEPQATQTPSPQLPFLPDNADSAQLLPSGINPEHETQNELLCEEKQPELAGDEELTEKLKQKEPTPEDDKPIEQVPEQVNQNDQITELAQPNEQVPEDLKPNEQVPEDLKPNEQVPEDLKPNEQAPEDVKPSEQAPEVVKLNEDKQTEIQPEKDVDPQERTPCNHLPSLQEQPVSSSSASEPTQLEMTETVPTSCTDSLSQPAVDAELENKLETEANCVVHDSQIHVPEVNA